MKRENWRIRDERDETNKNRNNSFNWRDRSSRERASNNAKSETSSSFNRNFNRPRSENLSSFNKSRSARSNDFGYNKNFEQKRGWQKKTFCNKNTDFNLEYMKELCSLSSEEAMTRVSINESDFQIFLENNMDQNVIVITTKFLAHICHANFTEIMSRILNHACNDSFLHNIENYLKSLPFESLIDKIRNNLYHEDIEGFWSNLVTFFQKVIDLMPRTACDKLTSILQKIQAIIPSIENSQEYCVEDKVKNEIMNMGKDLEEEIKKIEKNMKGDVEEETKEEPEPLKSFRNLSVIPTFADLYDQKPFIRACKVKEPYDCVEQYLDIQFRLLREDFVRPLRNGINEYLEGQGAYRYRNNDLRIYKNTNLMNVKTKDVDEEVRVYFGKLNFVDWRHSKRLTFGGLLLLSNDNFKTVIFATVANRDEVAEGYITIEPCQRTIIGPEMYDCNLVMLESKIYFEPYFAVLTAMQKIDVENFPMENYFIKNETISKKPAYLNGVARLKFQDRFPLPISSDDDWPSAVQLKLDSSQYQAFKSALTQEIAIIQGPPGTGKTFLALLIVQALLENKKLWIDHGPIVVVCLTNHALDQFLEGICDYTRSIVRVGSRSKNENLKSHSLAVRRKDFGCYPANSYLLTLKHEMDHILWKIKKYREYVNYLTTPNCIVPMEALVKEGHIYSFDDFSSLSKRGLVNWLIVTQNSSCQTTNSDNTEKSFDELILNPCYDDFYSMCFCSKPKFEYDMPVYPLDIITREIKLVENHIGQLYIEAYESYMPLSPIFELISVWEEHLNVLFGFREFLERELSNHPLINKTGATLSRSLRWQQYFTLIDKNYIFLNQEIIELQKKYRDIKLRIKEAKHMADLEVMKNHEIVGLTTTCAAKIQSSLRALSAPIVLVEEAAEILEAHVVCAMTKDCQQVILIGDHKQLRPKASVYELGKKYNLNVSLFERMVNIRGKCAQLEHQHRMRPEIAKLVSPIYDTLYNHESVYEYPNVKGLDGKNLFFLHHESHEESHHIDDSWINKHEVEFFSVFAKHLLMQGYSPDDITILCTYTGQMFAFMNETKYHSLLEKVRVTTVDNFQGEENKIILLSLVRNNGEGNIGFLREENRVCVALSRAREGLYIMGNMNDLLANNDIWPKIKELLEDKNAIGDHIKLKCQIHQDQIFQVKNAEDFKQCPEGGCLKKCDLLLRCGHSCTNICHILDREHEEYRCKEKCSKSCPNEHPCQLRCWQGCCPCLVKVERTLKCGHIVYMPCSEEPDKFACPVEVEVTLPLCGHATKKPCYLSVEKVQCDYDCEIRLDCGHACVNKCHAKLDPDHLKYECYKDCTKKNAGCSEDHLCRKRCFENCDPCPILIDKIRSCGHYFKKIECSQKVEDIFCKRECNWVLECGHKCLLKCSDECGNCSVMVKKESSCGHCITIKCCEEATPSKCNNNCKKTLSCGHPCTKKCKESCVVACKAMQPLTEPGACGHIFSIPCYLKNTDPKSKELVKYCREPCNVKLACTHSCKGNCGSCLQGRIHIACSEPCRNIFICGHACTTACNQECQPCTKKCELKCSHNKCGKNCGMPCAPCKEKCIRKCAHQSCTKRCYEICNVEPCNKPCRRKLKCKHSCVGFCGDPCPPLCLICNKEELTEMFLGYEDEPDARFVLLPDCQHVIENKGLMEWVKPSLKSDKSVEIKIPTCPRCKTPIKSCLRIMDEIKKDLKDVIAVKKKLFSNNKTDLEERKKKYMDSLETMLKEISSEEFNVLNFYVHDMKKYGKPVNKKRKQQLSNSQVDAFENILDILVEIYSLLKKIQKTNISTEFIKAQVNFLVGSLPTKLQLSKQRLDDIQLELRRLHLMVKVYNIFSESEWIDSDNQKEYQLLVDSLSDFKRFTGESEEKIISDSKELNKQNRTKILIERNNIVKAVGLTQGHWFKCPNGHFYAIGECGGAMERSICIECKASVGGENHQLDSTNLLATEIDGAIRPAWPTALLH